MKPMLNIAEPQTRTWDNPLLLSSLSFIDLLNISRWKPMLNCLRGVLLEAYTTFQCPSILSDESRLLRVVYPAPSPQFTSQVWRTFHQDMHVGGPKPASMSASRFVESPAKRVFTPLIRHCPLKPCHILDLLVTYSSKVSELEKRLA